MNSAALPFLPSLFALPSSSLSPAAPALLVFCTLFSPCLKLSSLDLPESSEITLDWRGFAASGPLRVASSP